MIYGSSAFPPPLAARKDYLSSFFHIEYLWKCGVSVMMKAGLSGPAAFPCRDSFYLAMVMQWRCPFPRPLRQHIRINQPAKVGMPMSMHYSGYLEMSLMSGGVLVQGQESGDFHFATELEQKLGDYEKAWSRLRANAGLGPVRKASVLDHNGTPDGKACKDYHKQCAWWADKVLRPPAIGGRRRSNTTGVAAALAVDCCRLNPVEGQLGALQILCSHADCTAQPWQSFLSALCDSMDSFRSRKYGAYRSVLIQIYRVLQFIHLMLYMCPDRRFGFFSPTMEGMQDAE